MVLSKNKPIRFGLYGEAEILLPDFLHCESMEYRSKKHNWVIKDHLHANLFQLFFIERGKVTYKFQDEQHLVAGPVMVIIPENTLHGLVVGKNIKGMVLTLSTSFLETVFRSASSALMELSQIRILKNVKEDKSFAAIKALLYELHDEIREELPEKGLILQSQLSLLLSKLFRLSIDISDNFIEAASSYSRYFNFFLRSIKKSYTPMKSIKHYARELNITTVHLNRICQATVGKSALQVVDEFLFLEAEKYLKHTEYSISEVAYRLNFEDPAYFSRFFSKYAGVSPKVFRETK
ncbi:MAG TPA: helix-turn-helix domain-containing protein [Chryseolinea sp.]|nr:helix-turn-helix domain-containing protein [Chryseolinea sp.]